MFQTLMRINWLQLFFVRHRWLAFLSTLALCALLGLGGGWLVAEMGPFITALVRLHGDAGRQRARQILDGFRAHLSEAGLGSVSEIFDAESPFTPRGCISQAWSVGELLRSLHEDVEQEAPDELVHV